MLGRRIMASLGGSTRTIRRAAAGARASCSSGTIRWGAFSGRSPRATSRAHPTPSSCTPTPTRCRRLRGTRASTGSSGRTVRRRATSCPRPRARCCCAAPLHRPRSLLSKHLRGGSGVDVQRHSGRALCSLALAPAPVAALAPTAFAPSRSTLDAAAAASAPTAAPSAAALAASFASGDLQRRLPFGARRQVLRWRAWGRIGRMQRCAGHAPLEPAPPHTAR